MVVVVAVCGGDGGGGCWGVGVCTHTQAHKSEHVCKCVWRSEISIRCCSLGRSLLWFLVLFIYLLLIVYCVCVCV